VLVPEPAVVSFDPLAGVDTDTINRQGILAPVFFHYDSDAIDDAGQKVLMRLPPYPEWRSAPGPARTPQWLPSRERLRSLYRSGTAHFMIDRDSVYSSFFARMWLIEVVWKGRSE
jgi:hypothetical protein